MPDPVTTLSDAWRYGRLAPLRHFLATWLDWRTYPWQARRVHGYFVRGTRGWADNDAWSLDHHLAGILKDALRYIAESDNGTPGSFVEYDADGNAVDFDRDRERWHAWLLDKAAWFDWYWRDDDCLELYADGRETTEEEQAECARASIAKHKEFHEVVLPDFVKHFSGLWV